MFNLITRRTDGRALYLALSLLLLLLLAACAPAVTPTLPRDSTAAATLRIAAPFLSTPIDPVQGGGWYAIQWGAGETLMRLDTDFAPVPWLAEALTQLDDRQWEIKLRPGATFHDGTPVDGEAVRASLIRAIENSATAKLLLDVQEIKVVDAQTLIIVTNAPNYRMPGVLTEPTTTIVQATAAAEQGKEVFGLHPIMTGPFVVEEVIIGQAAKLHRYAQHWAGPAALGGVAVAVLADADARMLALQSGEVDIAADIRPESVTVAEADETLHVVKAQPVATIFMYINQHKPRWQDLKLRQALAYATPDRNALVKTVLRDQGIPGVGLFSPAVLACDGLTALPPDLEQAKQLLAEAGYADSDGDGIVEKAGEPLILQALTYPQRPALTPTAEILQANLLAIGIQLEIRNVEDINAALQESDWDIGMYFNNMAATGDPYGSLSNFFLRTGEGNRGGYASDAVDAQINTLRDTRDLAERRAQACAISQQLLDEVAIVPLFYPFYAYGVSNGVTSFDAAHPFFLYFVAPEMGKQ